MNFSRRAGLLAGLGLLGGVAAGCSAGPAASSPAGSPSGSPTPADPASASTGASPTPTPSASAADPLPRGPVNALLCGTDSRTPGADTGNADAIVLAQLSADRTRLALVSVTRDSYVPLATGGRGKINAAYARGGADGLKRTVSTLFGGLAIPYTAQTDFTDFIELTKLLDGFTVNNRVASSVTSSVTGTVTRFPAGRLTLHGADWLIYARQRKGLPRGDLDRAERHRAVLAGMLARVKEIAATDPVRFARLAASAWTKVRVTGPLTAAQVPALGVVLGRLDARSVTSLQVPVAGYRTVGGASVNILDAAKTRALGAALRAGDVRAYVQANGTS